MLTSNFNTNRIYNLRQSELSGLGGAKDKNKKKPASTSEKPLENEDQNNIEAKRLAIMSEINYESTMFGLWLISLIYLSSFCFTSFVVLRFWPTGL